MGHPRSLEPAIHGRTERASADREIARLAGRQHGVVSRAQLFNAGLDRHAVAHRIDRGRLHAVHRGVYAVGHTVLSQEGRWMAAVLATGGVVSHRAAGAIWGLWWSERIEVTTVTVKRQPGIRAYRSTLPPDEVTIERGIPVTTAARTLLDLATVLPGRHLEQAINEAEVRRLAGPLSVWDLIDRYPRRHGTAALKAILRAQAATTRSELEALFRQFARRRTLRAPETNASVQVQGQWIECDCVWRRERVIVELDGRIFHSTAMAFERDRARDRRLAAAGWIVIRVTWRQLRTEPDALEADLRTVLGRHG